MEEDILEVEQCRFFFFYFRVLFSSPLTLITGGGIDALTFIPLPGGGGGGIMDPCIAGGGGGGGGGAGIPDPAVAGA